MPQFLKPFGTLTQFCFSSSKTDPFLKLKSNTAAGFTKKKLVGLSNIVAGLVKQCGRVRGFSYENAGYVGLSNIVQLVKKFEAYVYLSLRPRWKQNKKNEKR